VNDVHDGEIKCEEVLKEKVNMWNKKRKQSMHVLFIESLYVYFLLFFLSRLNTFLYIYKDTGSVVFICEAEILSALFVFSATGALLLTSAHHSIRWRLLRLLCFCCYGNCTLRLC
jgi:hypothetical protein